MTTKLKIYLAATQQQYDSICHCMGTWVVVTVKVGNILLISRILAEIVEISDKTNIINQIAVSFQPGLGTDL